MFFDYESTLRVWYPRRPLKPAWQNWWENTGRVGAVVMWRSFTWFWSRSSCWMSCKRSRERNITSSQFTYLELHFELMLQRLVEMWREENRKCIRFQCAKDDSFVCTLRCANEETAHIIMFKLQEHFRTFRLSRQITQEDSVDVGPVQKNVIKGQDKEGQKFLMNKWLSDRAWTWLC